VVAERVGHPPFVLLCRSPFLRRSTWHPWEFRRKLSPGRPKALEFLRRWKSLSRAAQRAYFTALRFRVIARLRRRLSFLAERKSAERKSRSVNLLVRLNSEWVIRDVNTRSILSFSCWWWWNLRKIDGDTPPDGKQMWIWNSSELREEEGRNFRKECWRFANLAARRDSGCSELWFARSSSRWRRLHSPRDSARKIPLFVVRIGKRPRTVWWTFRTGMAGHCAWHVKLIRAKLSAR